MAIVLTIAFVLFLIFHPIGNVLLWMIVSAVCFVFELIWAAVVVCFAVVVIIICYPFSWMFKSK